MSITVRGIIFAAPTAPGYAVGKRVIVTAVIDFTAPQIAAIDAEAGAPLTVASVPVTSVDYILDDGTQYDHNTPGALTATVTVQQVQAQYKTTGERSFSLALADQSGLDYHTGNVALVGWGIVGTVWEGATPTITDTSTAGAGDGLAGVWYLGTGFQGTPKFQGNEAVNFEAYVTAPQVPHTGIPDLRIGKVFCARWTGLFKVPSTGLWKIGVRTTGAISLWIDDTLVLQRPAPEQSWSHVSDSNEVYFPPVPPVTVWGQSNLMTAGALARIRLDYQAQTDPRTIVLLWQSDSVPQAIVPVTSLYASANPVTVAEEPPVPRTRYYVESVNRYEES